MKKWLLCLIALVSPAMANIGINEGNQKTVAAEVNSGLQYQAVEIVGPGAISTAPVTSIGVKVDLTTTSIPTAIYLASGTPTNPLSMNVIATPNVVSTFTIVIGTAADNGVAAGPDRIRTLPSIYQTTYQNGTAATQGRNGALSQGTDGLLWSANLPALRPASYSASTGTITTAASATDIASLCGNGTNLVLVYGMRASCTQTTAGIVSIGVFKSTQPFTGIFSTMTFVESDDTTYAVAVSSAITFSINPTLPSVGYPKDYAKFGCMATGTATPNDIYISPATWRVKPIVLRGANQCLNLTLLGATVTGGLFTATFDWMEISTITE